MGAKKIEIGGEVHVVGALETGEHSTSSKPGGGYASMLRKGLLGGQPGANVRSSLAPERPGETGESKVTINGAFASSSIEMSELNGGIGGPEVFNLPAAKKVGHFDSMSDKEQGAWVGDHEDGSCGSDGFVALEDFRTGTPTNHLHKVGSKDEECSMHGEESRLCPSHGQNLVQIDIKRAPLADREYRPPALRLPAASVEVEFAFQQTADADVPGHPVVLPVSLANSPHACKQVVLDPNAREFTPSPSPCPSPVLPPGRLSIACPYPLESCMNYVPGLELTPLIYRAEIGGAPVLPIFPNGAPIEYGPLPVSPTPWEGQPMTLQGERGQFPAGCGSLGPAMGPQPLPQQHAGLQPFGIAHQGMPAAFLPLGMAAPGPSVPSAIPPPLTGREHVSRALLLSGIPTELSEPQLRQTLENWGNVRALALDRRSEGLVCVQYYDLRDAKEALRDVQHQHLMQQQRMQQRFQLLQKQHGLSSSPHLLNAEFEYDGFSYLTGDEVGSDQHHRGMVGGRAVWAQYTSPAAMLASTDSMNQGTLVVFNLDAEMSLENLRQAFEVYGAVKELRETPAKKQHKFVEFFDIRDAARALNSLDGQEIGGKRVKIEFSRPGGQARRQQRAVHGPAQAHEVSHVIPLVDSRLDGSTQGHPLYLPGWGLNGCIAPSPSASGTPPLMWANYGAVTAPPVGVLLPAHYQSYLQPPATIQTCASRSGSHLLSNRRYSLGRGGGRARGSCPQYGGCGDSVFSKSVNCGSSRGGGLTGRRQGLVNVGPKLQAANPTVTCEDKFGDSSSCLRDCIPGLNAGISRAKSPLRDTTHSQYVFDEGEAVSTSVSCRTTLMIKNIPNKYWLVSCGVYSQSMLLNLLDEHCKCCNSQKSSLTEPDSAYDFVYLPIDFKNKCNLGYAFVNMTTVQATLRLYKAFHAQQWLAFNSRKVCQVTYARVQGRAALEDHFRNSRFACDTDEYLPLVFSPARTGIVCPPPTVAAGHFTGKVLSREEVGAGDQRAGR